MPDIKELAVSYWRMDKWLKNVNVERKMAATSSIRAIKRYLDSNNIEVLDLTGERFDIGLAVDVINKDVPDDVDENQIIISEMIKPIVMQDGAVIQLGQVSIGLSVKESLQNNTLDVEKMKSVDAENKKMQKALSELEKENAKNLKIKKIGLCGLIVVVCCFTGALSFAIYNGYKFNNAVADLDVANKTITQMENNKEEVVKEENAVKEDVNTDDKQQEDGIIQFKEYEVTSGDTLESICNENNLDYITNIETIKTINSISNADVIYAGQTLLLPINKNN